ncbi:MAG: hypothetical protein ACK5LR_09595 [Mangrovibacterium sp.]
MKKYFIMAVVLLSQIVASSQNVNNIQMPELLNDNSRKNINIPNIMGYITLKCDFHIHTVFSDGVVWPTVRVDEAWQEGLDAIAITDHIENNPSKKFIGGDDNSSYEIAKPKADEKDIILIHGGEITRSMTPGHFNALFLDDVNALDVLNYMDAFKAAADQGAFIIWNHPGWKAQQPDSCIWWPLHTELLEKGWLHAVEVFNEKEWYPITVDWCNEKNIAPIATSDIHGITAAMYNLEKYHRPLTIVFADDRSEKAIKEALFAKRTVAWFGDKLAGDEKFLREIFKSAIEVKLISESEKGQRMTLKNNSDVPFHLHSEEQSFTISSNGETMVTIKPSMNLFAVKNLFVAATDNLVVTIIP